MFDLFPQLPRWLVLIIIALVVYAVFNRRRIFLWVGKLLTPHQVMQRWNALASTKDVTNSTKKMGDTIVEEVTDGLVAQLPELLSEDFTDKVRTDVLDQLPTLLSDSLVERVLAKLPEALELRAAKTIANLTAQVNSLRKQAKGEGGWVSVGVHVRGFKMSEEDKEEYYALVEYNYQSGGLRAEQNATRRLLVPKSMLGYSRNPFYHCQRMATHLGSPWYGKVNGDPKSIVMLGEAYTLFQ